MSTLSLRRMALFGASALLTVSTGLPGLYAQVADGRNAQQILPPRIEAASIALPAGKAPAAPKQNGSRTLQSAPDEIYSHGDPTNDEQYMLELVNRARANPTAEGERLATVNDPEINNAYQVFQISRDQLRTDFAGYAQRPPLAFNAKLIASARRHSNDMDKNNFQDHTGSDGSKFNERIGDAGYGFATYMAENIAAYSSSVLNGHISLNVDWGVASLGHRKAIMSIGNLTTEIGIGIVHNGQNYPHTGPYVVTQNYGNATNPFLLGVVYHDRNSNNMYDPGEGIPGVTVMPSSGKYYAVTSASGGYAIPAPAGAVTLTASGGGLPTPMTSSVTVSGESIKVDFKAALASLPAQVSLTSPADGASINGTSGTTLLWEPASGATEYNVQVSTGATFRESEIVLDESVSGATTFTAEALENLTTYYWRVRAGNDQGWGDFSTPRRFTLSARPAAVTLTSPQNGGTVPPGPVTLRWERGAAEEERYWFEFGTDPMMTVVVMSDTMITEERAQVGMVATGMTYYWRVRAFNQAGWGPASPIWSFSVGTSGVTAPAANSAFRLSANTPNPFSGSTTIGFELAAAGEISLRVLDGLGQEVATLAAGRFSAGAHQVRFDAAGLANGVYYYQLRAGDITETGSMILAR